VRRNSQHRSILTVVSDTSPPPLQPLRHQWNVCHQVVNRFTRQTLPTANSKHFFLNILCIESFCSQKWNSIRLLFGITFLKHGRHIDYWNQPLNMLMRVYYLDSHETRLCCYLVIQLGNRLRQLQLFYFHLWPIYWLTLVSEGPQSKWISFKHYRQRFLEGHWQDRRPAMDPQHWFECLRRL
jgi:hypothetical protein